MWNRCRTRPCAACSIGGVVSRVNGPRRTSSEARSQKLFQTQYSVVTRFNLCFGDYVMSYAITNGNDIRRAGCDRGDVEFALEIVPASYFSWKDAFGRCLALVLLILGLPIMLLTMLLVRLTSPGPSIFRQRRVGKDGTIYIMYKIRSMR